MRICVRKWLFLLALAAVIVLPLPAAAQSQPRGFMGIGVDEARPGIFVAFVYEDGPAEAAGVRSGDEIVEMNGLPATLKDVGWPAPPGTIARLKIRRGQETFEVELTRRPRGQTKLHVGVFHFPREKVWAGLVAAISDPALSRMYRPKQVLREDGIIFFERVLLADSATPENARILGLIDPETHFPGLGDHVHHQWWATPTVRLRDKPGATVVTVTLNIDAIFGNYSRQLNVPTGGAWEAALFQGIWRNRQ